MEYSKVADQFGDWGPKFKSFIESSDFDEIFDFLKKESREGKVICPHYTQIFRAFKETPYKDLKCIFLGQDPYPWIKNGKYVADGIAMSCSNTGFCQPSLTLFYDGIADDLGKKVVYYPDLAYLAAQGVLFINCSMTVELQKRDSHKGVWDKFINFLIQQVINFYNRGLVYVALGQNAQSMAKTVMPFLHWGFDVEHPAAASHRNRTWKHENVFTKINKIMKDCNNQQINWIYGA